METLNPIQWEAMSVVLIDTENHTNDIFMKITMKELGDNELILCLRSDIENINKTKPRVEVYLTYWNNFAAHSDFNNTNKAYELIFYAYRQDLLKNGTFNEKFDHDMYELWSGIISRAVQNFITNNKDKWLSICKDPVMKQTQMRVSHIVWCDKPHTSLNHPQYEYVNAKAHLKEITNR